jgi:hypothetical protein
VDEGESIIDENEQRGKRSTTYLQPKMIKKKRPENSSPTTDAERQFLRLEVCHPTVGSQMEMQGLAGRRACYRKHAT